MHFLVSSLPHGLWLRPFSSFQFVRKKLSNFFGILVAEYLKWYECILSIINEYQAGFNGLPVHILTSFQIIRRFGFSRYAVFAMHLDIHYV